jgi:hypothetical protein
MLMKSIPFLFLLLSVSYSFGQSSKRIESILASPRIQLPKLNLPETETTKYIPCDFAGTNFSKESLAQLIQSLTTIKVYYVYTQYKQSASFDQLSLDRKRLTWFAATFPSVMSDFLVDWQILEQTGCTDYTQGDSYFHGFVLVHRPAADSKMRADEINSIAAYIDNPTETFDEPQIDPIVTQLPAKASSSNTSINNTVNRTAPAKFLEGETALLNHFRNNLENSPDVTPQRIDKWVSVSFIVKADSTVDSLVFKETYVPAAKDQVENAFDKMPEWIPATVNGRPVDSQVNMEIRVSYAADVNGLYTRDGIKPDFSDSQKNVPVVEEESTSVNLLVKPEPITVKSSAVYKGLELFKGKTNTALVMDVTGSMTTHIAAMLHWVRLYHLNSPFTSYTFFNDGDMKTTKQKKIGETQGIYMAQNFEEVGDVIKKAMMKGNGGEAPENDLEAVIHAFTNDANAHSVVLVGDNYSEVRDLELLTNITRPVHVILCAAPKFVRCDYLSIAKETGGLFILNGETFDLSAVQKGEIIQIQKIDYKYTGSTFETLYKGEIIY